jgi:hypothetical protein
MNRVLLASVLTAAAQAQAAAAPPAADDFDGVLSGFHIALSEVETEWKRAADEMSREMRSSFGTMFGGRMISGKVVKGAPYSAEIVTESNQTLGDGNVISKKSSARVFRDSEGRTRQDFGEPGKNGTVFISDPVGGRNLFVDPATKRAVSNPRLPVPGSTTKSKQVIRADGTEVRIEDGKVFIDGRAFGEGNAVAKSRVGKEVKVENGRVFIDGKEVATIDGSGPHVIVKQIDSGDGVRREEVRVQVVRAGDGNDLFIAPMPPKPPGAPTPPNGAGAPLPPTPPVPLLPGIGTLRFESTAHLGKGVTASLGTKEFDGVKAEGKSTTWTIPAGEIGNRNPISIVSENWYSPELQVTVFSRYADPRTGESIYRLAGIRRGEPPADLFTAPADYSVSDRAKQREEALERAREQRERAREQRDRAREQRERDKDRRQPG